MQQTTLHGHWYWKVNYKHNGDKAEGIIFDYQDLTSNFFWVNKNDIKKARMSSGVEKSCEVEFFDDPKLKPDYLKCLWVEGDRDTIPIEKDVEYFTRMEPSGWTVIWKFDPSAC